ncbi:hypothetical protein TIFTF001_025185 [Ficus carica]|uniref:Uncharacterized protein n=1 Tax=Ficus carica TaxID=3494 RepID=A0AA88DKI4_FICCA|nr:hypothetical protein TIFTF001_025185 [Ficus carica]
MVGGVWVEKSSCRREMSLPLGTAAIVAPVAPLACADLADRSWSVSEVGGSDGSEIGRPPRVAHCQNRIDAVEATTTVADHH